MAQNIIEISAEIPRPRKDFAVNDAGIIIIIIIWRDDPLQLRTTSSTSKYQTKKSTDTFQSTYLSIENKLKKCLEENKQSMWSALKITTHTGRHSFPTSLSDKKSSMNGI